MALTSNKQDSLLQDLTGIAAACSWLSLRSSRDSQRLAQVLVPRSLEDAVFACLPSVGPFMSQGNHISLLKYTR